ncbi:MAG: 30S ribosomal protein S19e [Desulfurococcaceae archaeon]
MVTALEVPADALIRRLAEYLEDNVPEVKPPSWAPYVKTGCFKEHPPEDPKWWYTRAASILRTLYKGNEPVGIETLRTVYGGRKRRGVRPPHSEKASGSIIRKILQQLEDAGLVKKVKGGRVLSPQGRALMDRLSYEILRELARKEPELAKYLGRTS